MTSLTQFMAQYPQDCRGALQLTATATAVLGLGLSYGPGNSLTFDTSAFGTVFYPESFSTYDTDQGRIQAAIYAARDAGGGLVRLGAKTYVVDKLILPNSVNLEGVDQSVSVIQQSATAVGPLITDFPQIASSTPVGGKHSIRRIRLDGNNAGIIKATGTVASASNVITGVSSTAGLAVGYIAEGIGIPDFTTVDSFTTNTVTLSAAGTVNATGTKLIWREAVVLTATATATLNTVAVTAGAIGSVKVGMRAYGANLDAESDDLSQHNWVTDVNTATGVITMDRPAKTSGSFQLLCFVANTGILVAEPFYLSGFDAGKEYRAPTLESVHVHNMSGDGIMCRVGRDQLHILTSCKFVLNYGVNVYMAGVNDCEIEAKVGMGVGWKGNLKVSNCSTARINSCDIYDEAMSDKYYGIQIRSCRQIHINGGDLNGRMLVHGKTGETSHAVRISGLNFKWHGPILVPDVGGSIDAYLTIQNGAQVVLDSPYYYGDQTDNTAPNYLWLVKDASTLMFSNMRLITALGGNCPFKVGIANLVGGSILRGWYHDSSNDLIVQFGDIAGRPEGLAAAAGAIGEVQAVKVAIGSAVALTTTVIANLGSMTLTPGDWDERCIAHFNCTGATVTKLEVGMPGNSATIPASADQHATWQGSLAGFTGEISLAIPPFRNANPATATERLNVRATFSAGTVAAYGASSARRMR